ncbi:extracellular matrix protein 1 isoform X2 [Monodelphis domestica]|uniref:extracellular matrix protein 1 isoform X2 n=1 Tax=Monodelphis domestica TaxID=13616 RepID=UPI0004434212|nr:extracellular matrix protein 1 isoform X2 [Monodelphis domestica]
MPAACPAMGATALAALLLMLLALGASAQGGPSEQREAIPEHFPKEVGYAAPPAPSSPQKPDLQDLVISHRAFEGQTEAQDFFEDFPLQQAQSPQKLSLGKKEPSPSRAVPIQKEVEPPRHLPMDQREAQSSSPALESEEIPHQEQKEVIPSQFGELPPALGEEHQQPRRCRPEGRPVGWGHRLDSFPPGRPSPKNMHQICHPERKHVVYGPWNLPQTGYSHLSRQGNALNFLETGYTRCCHLPKDQLDCAEFVWEEALDSYCDEELAIKTHHHVCCQHPASPARDICFARHAPYPNYDRDILTVDLSRITPDTMAQLCGHRKVLTKHKHIPGLIRNMTARCCELAPPEQGFCAEEEKSAFIRDLCGSRRDSWRDTESCCDHSPGDEQTCCFNTHYLRNVALVAGVPQKPRGQQGTGTTELPLVTPTPEHKGE